MVSLEKHDGAALSTVLQLASEVESIAVQHGLMKSLAPRETKELFLSLDPVRQGQILRDLTNTRALLETMEIDGTREDARENERAKEIRNLSSFLRLMNMKLADESFFDRITGDDMIEVYDARAIQIYCNWVFFKLCPYSLLELLVNDWNTLFVRPSWVIERLIEMTPALFSPGATTVQYELPEYLISARLQRNSPGLLFKMKYATPVLDANSGQPIAFVTTGFMRRAPETATGRNIDFI